MNSWTCAAARGLPVDEDSAWDGPAAEKAIFSWAGWPDNPDADKAKRAFLAFDESDKEHKQAFKLPFATVKDGTLTAVRAGLHAAASRLSQTDDLPESVQNEAGDVLDSYKPADDKDRGLGLTYSRVLHIDTRIGAAQDDLLSVAKSRAQDPTIFDEHPPFFFNAEISSNRWDSYQTQMQPSSLRNYADDAQSGIAFLRNHDTTLDPLGHSLTGTYTGAQGNGVARVNASFYMLTDPETQPYVNKIRAGVVKDVSIGFYGGQWICTICGRNMEEWYTRDGCPHLLGMTYTPADETGRQKGDPVMARAKIEGAHVAEVSGVYSGSTPGAMIDKARAMADAGLLDYRMHELVQTRYKVRLPGGTRIHAVDGRRQTEEAPVDPEARIQELETRTKELETKLTRADVTSKAFDAVRASLAPVELPTDHPGTTDPVEAVRWLVTERARLVPLADDGRAYRGDLIAAAMTEGVRAMGNDFQQELYKDVLERSPLAVIKRMRDDWAAVAAKTFPGGRQTTDEDQAGSQAGSEHKIPAAAFQSGR